MSNILKVDDWRGVFSNADLAQIDPALCAELENLRPVNGKLVKTFGCGVKINVATAVVLTNLCTYIHDELTGDKLYIGIYVNTASDNAVTVYGWNGTAWVTIGNISGVSWASGSFFHNAAINPIVYADGILRLLPGNLGASPSGGYECAPFWLGYIDRDYFDGLYSPTAQFYGMNGVVAAPSLTFTATPIGTDEAGLGPFAPNPEPATTNVTDYKYYKFSYIYDGIEESLLTDAMSVMFTENSFLQLAFTITKASHNKRVTAMKVYRADTHDGPYNDVGSIDFLRSSDTIAEDTNSTAYDGRRAIYIPAATAFNFNASKYYAVALTNDDGITEYILITTPSGGGTGHDTFYSKSIIPPLDNYDDKLNNSYWDAEWYIAEDDVERGSYGLVTASGSSGAYAGSDVMVMNKNVGEYSYGNGIMWFAPGSAYEVIAIIATNYQKAVRYYGDNIGTLEMAFPWRLLKPADGLFYVADDTDAVNVTWYDTGFNSEMQHPLQNNSRFIEYIKCNGKFAKIINGRLLQFNVVLDPGGKNEYHNDWLMYSELGQYDVTPASNRIAFPDTKGGEGTGLAEVFGNPVILKPQSIFYINSKTYPADPARWTVIESAHKIGNLAPNGYAEAAGDLYVCHIDGIYRIRPNNLADTDSTPTEKLRMSEPIGDTYNNLSHSQKQAIKSAYNPETSEIVFLLNTEWWCFNIATETWREVTSAITPAFFEEDENGQALAYQNSDKKVYSLGMAESVAAKIVTKTFELSAERMQPVRYVSVTYKSAAALTMKVYYDDEIPSGEIAAGVTYTVREKPYINGSTFKVTYNGVDKTHGQTFVGTVGNHAYTTSGTGIVELYSSHTLPANGAPTAYRLRIGRWCKRMRIEITDAAGTSGMEIHNIEIAHE